MKKPQFNSVFKYLEAALAEATRLADAFNNSNYNDTGRAWDAYHLEEEIEELLKSYDHRKGEGL